MSKRLLVKVNALGLEDGNDQCEAVVVVLDDLKHLLKLRAKVLPLFKDSSFYAVERFNHDVEPVSYSWLADQECAESNTFFEKGYVELPDDAVVEESKFRVDASTVLVIREGFHWSFNQKNSGARFETQVVPWEVLVDILGETKGTPFTRSDLSLYQIQDPDIPMFVLAADYKEAIAKWQAFVAEEDCEVTPDEVGEPDGVNKLGDARDVLL